MRLLLILVITLLATVSCFPFTPFICDMNVAVLRHNNQTTTGLPTTTSERNILSLSSPVVSPGGSITITLSSILGIPSIYGFLIYARDSQNNHVGVMMGNSNSSPCNNLVAAGTTQGHNNAQPKDTLIFTWTAPTQQGAYLITCIVTEATGLTPFIIVPSKIITVQNGAPAPVTPAPTTPATPAPVPATPTPPTPPAATIPPPPPTIIPTTPTPPVSSTGGVIPPRVSSSSSTGGIGPNTTRIVFVRQIRARILAFIPSIKSFVQRLQQQLSKALRTEPRNIILTYLVRDTNQTATPTSNAVKQNYLQTYSSGKGAGIGVRIGLAEGDDEDEFSGKGNGNNNNNIPSFYLIGLAFLQPVDATNFKLALVKLASVDGQISAQSALAEDGDTVQLEYDTKNGLDRDGNVAIEEAIIQLTSCSDGTTVAVTMASTLCATETPSSSPSTSVNKGLAIGVAIGGVILLAIIIGGAVYYQKTRKSTKSTVTPRL